MTFDPAAPTAPPLAEAPETAQVGWNYGLIMKWLAAAALALSVLGMEVTGHAPTGTFISMVAGPGLAALGIHTAAKNLT